MLHGLGPIRTMMKMGPTKERCTARSRPSSPTRYEQHQQQHLRHTRDPGTSAPRFLPPAPVARSTARPSTVLKSQRQRSDDHIHADAVAGCAVADSRRCGGTPEDIRKYSPAIMPALCRIVRQVRIWAHNEFRAKAEQEDGGVLGPGCGWLAEPFLRMRCVAPPGPGSLSSRKC